jgi:hypothetical protein
MKMKRVALYLVVLIAGVFLAGCTSTPLVNKLMNPDVPVNDHAILYLAAELNDVMIDGEIVKSYVAGIWAQEGFKTAPIVVLTPGEHIIQAKYLSFRSAGYQMTEKTQTDYMSITHNFNAGRRYYMYSVVENNTVSFRIVDETNPTAVWRQGTQSLTRAEERIATENKVMGNIKYPSQISLAVSYNTILENAAAANPTKFEGTWQYEYTKAGEQYIDRYVFIGNAFVNVYTYNPKMDRSLGYVGTFDFTDNTITLTQLKKASLIRSSELTNIKQTSVVYGYSITPEGLILTSGNKSLGTFVKQQTDEEDISE